MEYFKLAGGLLSSTASSILPTIGTNKTQVIVNKNTVAKADPDEIHDGWLAVDGEEDEEDMKTSTTEAATSFIGVNFLFENDSIAVEIDPVSAAWTLHCKKDAGNPNTLKASGISAPIVELVIPTAHPSNIVNKDVVIQADLTGLTSTVKWYQLEDQKDMIAENEIDWRKYAVENTNHIKLPYDTDSKLVLGFNMDHKLLGGLDVTLQGKLIFELPASGPWFSWRFEVSYPYDDSFSPKAAASPGSEDSGDEEKSSSLPCITLLHNVGCRMKLEHPVNKYSCPNVYVNGWNSGSYSGTVPKSSDSRLGYTRTAFAPFFNGPNNESWSLDRSSPFYSQLFGEMFVSLSGAEFPTKWYAICGFLSQRQSFGSVTIPSSNTSTGVSEIVYQSPCDSISLFMGKRFATDPASLFLQSSADVLTKGVFKEYFVELARRNNARASVEVPTGWSSWHEFKDAVTEKDFYSNIAEIRAVEKQFPVSIIELDDGYQLTTGDWSTNPKFPNGLKNLADNISKMGKKPAIWIAPLISKPDAESVTGGSVTILKSKLNPSIPSRCGYMWSCEPVALDITAANTQSFVVELLKTAVDDWGYKYIKLDGLFAAAVEGIRSDPSVTRAQALNIALRLIRETVGDDVTLVGANCSIGAAIGYLDVMRIGPDVAPNFYPEVLGMTVIGFSNDPHFPSMKNAVRNVLARSEMNKILWVNDPDALICRPTDSKLSFDEIIGLASAIALSAGSFFVSDDLTKLTDERRGLAESLLPPLAKPATVLDVLKNEMPATCCQFMSASKPWILFAKFNWTEVPLDYKFEDLKHVLLEYRQNPEQVTMVYHVFEFWTKSYMKLQVYEDQVFFLGSLNLVESFSELYQADNDTEQKSIELPVHSARLFSVRKFGEQDISYIGSDVHFSGGNELISFEVSYEARTIKLVVNAQGRKSLNRSIWLFVSKDRMPTIKLSKSDEKRKLEYCGRGVVRVFFDLQLGDNLIELEW